MTFICGGWLESGARCGQEFRDPAVFWTHVDAHEAARARRLDARTEVELRQMERQARKLGIALRRRE